MDGEQVICRRSIQRDLSRWIMLASLLLVLIAGVISATLTFHEARELQDKILVEIGNLVARDHLSDVPNGQMRELEEQTIIIRELDSRTTSTSPGVPADIPDGLQTILLGDENWRVLAITLPLSGQRIAVAQQTELRDEIAWASSLNVMLPLLLLALLMLLLIHVIIRNRLQPLKSLTELLDQQDATQLIPLPEINVPQEIAPFVSSINALLERTRQAMEKQHRFIVDAAHELRTPVTALSLLLENVERADTGTERRERQALLRIGLDRLSGLIVQLLDLARFQSDLKGSVQVVSFDRIVQEAIADLYSLAEASGIDIGMTRKESISVIDQGGSLAQLVRNAIDNAIRYSPTDTKIDISLTAENGKAVFCVEDSGVGIPEDELQQVMQPFYRTNTTTQSGNGLGLAICHEIAQRLGGIISLSNLPSGGLRFLYSQPRADNDDAGLDAESMVPGPD